MLKCVILCIYSCDATKCMPCIYMYSGRKQNRICRHQPGILQRVIVGQCFFVSDSYVNTLSRASTNRLEYNTKASSSWTSPRPTSPCTSMRWQTSSTRPLSKEVKDHSAACFRVTQVARVHFFHAGRVLVNCLMGMSRSSTCVLAFLMLRRDMTAVQALTEVRRHRDIRPNDGFLRQLADLDNRLRRERGRLRQDVSNN